MWDLVNYSLLYAIADKDIQEIKIRCVCLPLMIRCLLLWVYLVHYECLHHQHIGWHSSLFW